VINLMSGPVTYRRFDTSVTWSSTKLASMWSIGASWYRSRLPRCALLLSRWCQDQWGFRGGCLRSFEPHPALFGFLAYTFSIQQSVSFNTNSRV